MKIEAWLFLGGVFLFAPIAAVYGFMTGWNEPVGLSGLVITTLLALMVGGYLLFLGGSIDPRPEDDPDGEIRQLAGPQGEFAPYSWTPLFVGASAAVLFAGFAFGLWLTMIGAVMVIVSVLAWVFEYYRGEHAH